MTGQTTEQPVTGAVPVHVVQGWAMTVRITEQLDVPLGRALARVESVKLSERPGDRPGEDPLRQVFVVGPALRLSDRTPSRRDAQELFTSEWSRRMPPPIRALVDHLRPGWWKDTGSCPDCTRPLSEHTEPECPPPL